MTFDQKVETPGHLILTDVSGKSFIVVRKEDVCSSMGQAYSLINSLEKEANDGEEVIN